VAASIPGIRGASLRFCRLDQSRKKSGIFRKRPRGQVAHSPETML
jgi:hypothetical protein